MNLIILQRLLVDQDIQVIIYRVGILFPKGNIHLWQAGMTLAYYTSFYDYIKAKGVFNRSACAIKYRSCFCGT